MRKALMELFIDSFMLRRHGIRGGFGHRARRSRRISQSQIILVFSTHPIGIGGSIIPLNSNPSVFAQIPNDTTFSRWNSILTWN